MEKTFKKSVLGIVQKTAYERLEVLESSKGDKLADERQGFMRVEKCGVSCSAIDKRIINRLKYIHASGVGKKKMPHKWIGYCEETKAYINLGEEWVTANFECAYILQVQGCCKSNRSFLHIPPGDS